jgi:restriction endonuclease S subunit
MRSDWAEVTLGDVLALEYGKALKAEDRDGCGYPVFGSAGEVGRHSSPTVKAGPVIVVGRKGNAGSVWWSDGPCSVIDTAYFVTPRASLNLAFLYLLLGHLNLPALSAQTGVPGLNRDRAYACKVLLPPSVAQNRIVDLVASVDVYIESLQQQADVARTARNAVLEELLSKADDWAEMSLKDLSAISYGYTESASAEEVGPKFLRITDIQNSRVNWDSVPFCPIQEPELKRQRLIDGDIVFARTGATTGKSFLIQNPPEAVCASYLIRLRPNSDVVSPHFLNLNFQTQRYWEQIQSGVSGSAQGGFNASKLGALTVGVPSKASQQRIVDIISSMDTLIRETESTMDLAKSARFGLLSDLLSGEHEIPAAYDRFLDAA